MGQCNNGPTKQCVCVHLGCSSGGCWSPLTDVIKSSVAERGAIVHGINQQPAIGLTPLMLNSQNRTMRLVLILKEQAMRMQKSIQADSAGRVNLGKECAGLLFTLSREDERFVLEPARVISERELRIRQEKGERIPLNKEEWAKFEELMDSDTKPTSRLRKLMKDKS